MDLLSKEGRKLERTIKNKFSCVLNPQNYLFPQTKEQFKAIKSLGPRLVIDGRWIYFKENSKKAFQEIIEAISLIPDIRDNNSYSSVYDEAKKWIELAAVSGNKDHIIFIKEVVDNLVKLQRKYICFAVVQGITFENVLAFDLGLMQVVCYKDCLDEIDKYRNSASEQHIASINNFMDNNFKDRILIRGETFGDSSRSKEKFVENCKLVINLLRLIACTFYVHGYNRKRFSINMPEDRGAGSVHYLGINTDSKFISLGWSSTEPRLMPISPEIINKLKEDLFLEDLISFMWGQSLSEVEGTIITAIHWIGEAQNDRNIDNSFVKYWIAIETIFSISDVHITDNIAIGVSTLLAFGGIVNLEEKHATYRKLKKLYKKRSKVVHRGQRNQVNFAELKDISHYAQWIVYSLLGLRRKGYKTLKQINLATSRLHKLHEKSNEAQEQSPETRTAQQKGVGKG